VNSHRAAKKHAVISVSLSEWLGGSTFLRLIIERNSSMRTISTLFILCFVLTHFGFAQEAKQPPKTKVESFDAKTGVVVIRGFSVVDKVKGNYSTSVTVEAKEWIDASSGKREYGISIEVRESEREKRSSYIDYDEIESLLKGIGYISKIDSKITKLNEFQADYKTKGEFEISTFSSDGKIAAAVKSGSIYSASAYFDFEDIEKIKTAIDKAKKVLDSIKQ